MTSTPTTLDSAAAANLLRSTATVRERATFLLDRARRDDSPWFTVDDDALQGAAARTADVTRARFPDGHIPFHSRWRHFEAGGHDRAAHLDAPAMVDLAVVSVLLDAGAGADWQYVEPGTGARLARSEGLGVASWHAFDNGAFSSAAHAPHRVDAAGLRALDATRLADAFQVSDTNPLVGLAGRVEVLHRLADALAARPDRFGDDGRPSGLLSAAGDSITAQGILTHVLDSFSGIWLADNVIGSQRLGDCWRHDAVPGPGLSAGWMPFHKLSQWLTYSLLEPFARAGITVTDLDGLTGLPEYRNGGLLLDTGALRLRDGRWAERRWTVDAELIVEWRALTVALLDELAPLVRAQLGADVETVPLARVLEGGTWATGRALAQQLRGGLPPLLVDSDGTVF